MKIKLFFINLGYILWCIGVVLMILLLIAVIVGFIWALILLLTEIEQVGLKSILQSLWEGSERGIQ